MLKSLFLYTGLFMFVLSLMVDEGVTDTQEKPRLKVDKTLRFNSNHEFTILQLSDLHYNKIPEENSKNMNLTNILLDLVKPDVVVVTGDSISGYDWDGVNPFYKEHWTMFTSPFVEKQTLYAYVLGNHDHQADYNYAQIADLERTNPYSLFNGDPSVDPDSLSNYRLDILSSFEGKEETPAASLWMFDSKDTGCGFISKSWGCITQNQLDWYTNTTNQLNQQFSQKIHGLAFFHIPTPEFLYMFNFYKTYGYKLEGVSCPKYNTNVIKTFAINGNIKGVFVGHDHDNDFGGFYDGIELVYCRKSGYGGYGPIAKNGGRVIKLKEKINEKGEVGFEYTHYIITVDGDIIVPGEPQWQGYKDFRWTCDFS